MFFTVLNVTGNDNVHLVCAPLTVPTTWEKLSDNRTRNKVPDRMRCCGLEAGKKPALFQLCGSVDASVL